MANQSMQPVFILPEGYNRQFGKDAQRNNIIAAKIVAETVRTTLGPRGMDKMLVDSMGDVIITNDGVTILKEMEIEHPAAKMMVEIAKTQEEEVGDGTTTSVVIAGELLKKAEVLLEQELHPTIIAKGYQLAAEKAQEILNKIAIDVSINDDELLESVVATAVSGKGTIANKEYLNKILVKAIKTIAEKSENKIIVNLDNLKLEKKAGGGINDTELINGITIDKERVHSEMPKLVKDAKILLLDMSMEVKETEGDAQIRVSSPEQLQAFIEQEEKIIKDMVEKVKKSGANVVFSQKGIDDLAQHFLSKAGIYACRRVKQSDMVKLAKATGAKILNTLDEIKPSDLGYAGIVEERKIAGEDMTFVKECKNPKAVTIFIRGGTEHVIDEVERAIQDAIGDLAAVLETGKIVAGGGAPEMEVEKELLKYAATLTGREQLAVKAFAEAMEVIPRTLAENAGLDPINILVNIKAAHEKGEIWGGVDINSNNIINMKNIKVLEPLKVKTQAIKSASEVAVMILRIDDVIAAGKINKPEGERPSMPEM